MVHLSMVSRTSTVPVGVPPPVLATVAVQVRVWPTSNGLGEHDSVLVVVDPHPETTVMVVGSVAVAGLLAPPPLTVALLVTEAAAVQLTFTVSVMAGKLPPEATAAVLVQVRVATLQVQPEPLMAVAVRPAGNVSVTVVVPEVAPGPGLPAVMV
jgi:hypothetical protein